MHCEWYPPNDSRMVVIQYKYIYIAKWSYRQNGLRMWTFGLSMKLWEKAKIFRAEDQGEKDASDFRD